MFLIIWYIYILYMTFRTSFRYCCIFHCFWLFELQLKSTFYSFWILCKFFPHFYWSNKYNKWNSKGRINKMSYNFNTLHGKSVLTKKKTLMYHIQLIGQFAFLVFLYLYVSVHVSVLVNPYLAELRHNYLRTHFIK